MVKSQKRSQAIALILAAVMLFTSSFFILSVETSFAATKPARVKKLKITNVTQNSVKLSWNRIKQSKGYQVYRAQKKKGKYKRIKTIKKNKIRTFSNKKLKANTKYFYKVRAYKVSNGKKLYGKFSSIKSVRTKKAVKRTNTPTVKPYTQDELLAREANTFMKNKMKFPSTYQLHSARVGTATSLAEYFYNCPEGRRVAILETSALNNLSQRVRDYYLVWREDSGYLRYTDENSVSTTLFENMVTLSVDRVIN